MIVENFYFNTAIILLASYLIGAFPSAYIAGKIKGINISKTGTGNVGGMNAFTNIGKIAGVLVVIADIGKGFLVAYLVTRFSGGHPYLPLWAVTAAVVGHNWMIYIGFKGRQGSCYISWRLTLFVSLVHPHILLANNTHDDGFDQRYISCYNNRFFYFFIFHVGLGRKLFLAYLRPSCNAALSIKMFEFIDFIFY